VVYRARVRHEISPHRLTHRRRRLSIAQLRPPRILAAPATSFVCSLCSPGLHCFSGRFSPAGLHRRACDRDFTPAGPLRSCPCSTLRKLPAFSLLKLGQPRICLQGCQPYKIESNHHRRRWFGQICCFTSDSATCTRIVHTDLCVSGFLLRNSFFRIINVD
jgi:hypothetical protein